MRIDRGVVNASPLIVLFRSQQHALLPVLFKEIAVPEAVWQEVLAGGPHDPAARELPQVQWAQRLPETPADPVVLAWDLGPGETAVLSFARHHPTYVAMVDDAAARRCAQALNIRVLGTCGLLVLAKRRGQIESVAASLQALREAGLWLSDTLVQHVLNVAGEH